MRNTTLILATAALLSSCVFSSYPLGVDTDDTYVMRHYDWNYNLPTWGTYRSPYSWYSPYLGYRPYPGPVIRPIIVVPRERTLQPGKRPDRESLPNHPPRSTAPRGRSNRR